MANRSSNGEKFDRNFGFGKSVWGSFGFQGEKVDEFSPIRKVLEFLTTSWIDRTFNLKTSHLQIST